MVDAYELMKKRLESESYDASNAKESLDMYLAYGRINPEQYKELMDMVQTKMDDKFDGFRERVAATEEAVEEMGEMIAEIFALLETKADKVEEPVPETPAEPIVEEESKEDSSDDTQPSVTE